MKNHWLTVCLSVSSQVISRLLSIPEAYWRQVLGIQTNQSYSQEGGHGAFTARLSALFDFMVLSCVRLCVLLILNWPISRWSITVSVGYLLSLLWREPTELHQSHWVRVHVGSKVLGLTLRSGLWLQVVGSNSYWSDSLWAEHKDQTLVIQQYWSLYVLT